MEKYNFLTVLNDMCLLPNSSVSLFTADRNLIAFGDTNIEGWGHIDMAVTKEVIEKIQNARLGIILFTFDVNDFKETMKKLDMG